MHQSKFRAVLERPLLISINAQVRPETTFQIIYNPGTCRSCTA